MKFLIFIFVVGILSVASALICTTSSGSGPATNVTCSDGVKFCMSVDVKYKTVEMKYQTCNGAFSVDNIPGLPKTCTAKGTTTMNATDTTGQYDCCDTDYCNSGVSLNPDKKPDNSAIKPFAFGFASLFIMLALLF